MTNLHGSAVTFAGRGIVILGASGTGKSALALRLVRHGAALVADDRVALERRGAALVASAPAPLAGLIEVRGLGILRLPAAAEAVVTLAVDLDAAPVARMPQRVTVAWLGIEVELISGRDHPNLDLALMVLVQNGRAFKN
jgi:HPr kinase/phosphorylase